MEENAGDDDDDRGLSNIQLMPPSLQLKRPPNFQ